MKLLQKAKCTPFEALWRFMLDSGARPGEALGLRWDDRDLDAGTVTNPARGGAGREGARGAV